MPDEAPGASERRRRGLAKLAEIDGPEGARLIEALRAIAPDFADHVVEFPFGAIFSRPGLDLRTRELAAVAALTAFGSALAQLRLHIRGALDVGAGEAEVPELVMRMAVFAGFPARAQRHRRGARGLRRNSRRRLTELPPARPNFRSGKRIAFAAAFGATNGAPFACVRRRLSLSPAGQPFDR